MRSDAGYRARLFYSVNLNLFLTRFLNTFQMQMPQDDTNFHERQVYTLSDITGSIARMFSKYYASPYWIRAEISKLNFYPASGHCFPDLVEKYEGKVKSQMRSIIWRDDLFRISQKFESVTREPLREGIAIMFQAYVKFTSEHGLSLNIIDIEPLYTLGEMAREKMASIERMKREGIFQLNKLIPLPLLLKNVAVISAETSKGYNDLMVTLNNNQSGYQFITDLFPAFLQGDGAVESIRKQLKRIKSVSSQYDAVLIIRGGGDEVGMACYDHYDLARDVALFPLPVITGIGHSTNETVVEMVACVNKITPTDVAHFLIESFRNFDERIQTAASALSQSARLMLANEYLQFEKSTGAFFQAGQAFLEHERETLGQMALDIRESVNVAVFNHRIALSRYESSLVMQPVQLLLKNRVKLKEHQKILGIYHRHLLVNQSQNLDSLEQRVRLLDPVNVLKRGFTITRFKGKAIGADNPVEAGASLVTETMHEMIESTVTGIKTVEQGQVFPAD